jgi:hypothetical protein
VLKDDNGLTGICLFVCMMIMSSHGMLGPRGGACGGATSVVAVA